ncbi:hypothetical protein [Saccharibacillus kuerlensis]|uniref:YhfH-like protein n=1 Tax=Saccharibacillus kuerlensis TaxID=459527 RepID=A0ABQ2L456_9BACL|nr:hypothetical protein [Saccharibacillus kuerlensis]GGO02120.1 hypothetical protein GCM10010969_25130 [Saccharibacillus kuerlensis]
MTTAADQMTRNYLNLCYNCQDAYLCETEEQCLACWSEQGLLDEAAPAEAETSKLLNLYYA